MAINIRTYSREDGSSHAGIWKGLPPRPDFSTPARTNRSRNDVSIQVDVTRRIGSSGGGARASSSLERAVMGRKKEKKGVATPLYSREDIREQYCINSKEIEVLERSGRTGRGIFGCLSSHKEKPCKKNKRTSFFALCVRHASDENLYNGCNKPGPNRSVTMPTLKPFTVPLKDPDLQPFRTRPQSFCTTDPRRYSAQHGAAQSRAATPPTIDADRDGADAESWRSNTLPRPRGIKDRDEADDLGAQHPFRYGGRLAYTQPNTPELSAALRRHLATSEADTTASASALPVEFDGRPRSAGSSKHVSFDASSPTSEIYTSAVPANSKSQERLLDAGRKTPEFLFYPPQGMVPQATPPTSSQVAPAAAVSSLATVHAMPQATKRSQGDSSTFSPVLARAILLERLRQASMRSQATQTDCHYNSCAVSTASLSKAGCVGSESTDRPSGASLRLSQSSSNVDAGPSKRRQPEPTDAAAQWRTESQPELTAAPTGDEAPPTASSSPTPATAATSRRHPLQKALSEGTMLLDRRRALSFASGYVEVDVRSVASPCEEAAVGRVLVHHSIDFEAPSPTSRLVGASMAHAASSSDTNRSLAFSDADDVAEWSDTDLLPVTPKAMSTSALNRSTGSTPANISDDFGSVSQVTVLAKKPVDPSPAGADEKDDGHDSDREIMVQFPPWPAADDASVVIPAPPNFATAAAGATATTVAAAAAAVPSSSAVPNSRSFCRDDGSRLPLHELHDRFKCMSETVTSADSDWTAADSERRVTEHETSEPTSPDEPTSPASDRRSPVAADCEISPPQVKEVGTDSTGDSGSETQFLTALSNGARASWASRDDELRVTSLGRDPTEGDESSRNSTLRHTADLPTCEERVTEEGVVVVADQTTLADPKSKASTSGGSDRSSTSGSYSLEAAGSTDKDEELLEMKEPNEDVKEETPTTGAATQTPTDAERPDAAARRLSYRSSSRSDDSRRFSRFFEDPRDAVEERVETPPVEAVDPATSASGRISRQFSTSPPLPPPPPASELLLSTAPEVFDRKKLKEGLTLQFRPETFAASPPPPSPPTLTPPPPPPPPTAAADATTPHKPTAGRRRTQSRHAGHESSPSSEDNEGGNTVTRRRPTSTGAQSKSSARSRYSAPASTSTPTGDVVVVKKRVRPESSGSTGMVRSPAMHDGFHIKDWVVQRSPQTEADPTVLVQPPSTSDATDAELQVEQSNASGGKKKLAAPIDPSGLNLSCESLRSVGSDSVFAAEPIGALAVVVGPPEGFQDSPSDQQNPDSTSNQSCSASADREPARKTFGSGRTQRAESCPNAPNKNDEVNSEQRGGCSMSSEALDRHGGAVWNSTELAASGVARPVSASAMSWFPETHLPPKRQLTVRAKSEERDRGGRNGRRQLVRSVDTSWESLGTSRSIGCDGTPLEDEDAGIYSASYLSASWAYIGETDEMQVWNYGQPPVAAFASSTGSLDGVEDTSTASEKEFRRKYTAITHRMVHRKSSMEMFKRLATSTFECDDVVVVKRHSGEFGFRIHGSRPVVVSAIEPGTPAEESGLRVGDIVIAINDVNVLDSSHSEVVRIAHAGSDELKLEVARTCHVLATAADAKTTDDQVVDSDDLLSGYLWKKSHTGSKSADAGGWYRRWFCLRKDHCLYYFKSQKSSQPLGAVSLVHYCVTRSPLTDRPHGLALTKGGTVRHWLAAETSEAADRWQTVLNDTARSAIKQDEWLDLCSENALLSPAAMASPDCLGHLMKLGHRAKEWQRRFCLLKDACLYFYPDLSAASALGAIHLHGYRVQGTGTASSSGERRKFAFELLPPEPRMRHFHFYTDSENDRKRWIAALEYSIDRWIRVG